MITIIIFLFQKGKGNDTFLIFHVEYYVWCSKILFYFKWWYSDVMKKHYNFFLVASQQMIRRLKSWSRKKYNSCLFNSLVNLVKFHANLAVIKKIDCFLKILWTKNVEPSIYLEIKSCKKYTIGGLSYGTLQHFKNVIWMNFSIFSKVILEATIS